MSTNIFDTSYDREGVLEKTKDTLEMFRSLTRAATEHIYAIDLPAIINATQKEMTRNIVRLLVELVEGNPKLTAEQILSEFAMQILSEMRDDKETAKHFIDKLNLAIDLIKAED
ncbi:MAG TPA: hypothetical protein P5052_04640 [Candidatus Paceibacterota bacterium]|nr:hypothetical protein [Candidatus Paceibacterota bacterium]